MYIVTHVYHLLSVGRGGKPPMKKRNKPNGNDTTHAHAHTSANFEWYFLILVLKWFRPM